MADFTVAKALLRDEQTTATACYRALDQLLGTGWLSWEPESIWLDLNHDDVDVPVVNREKIMAARALITTGRFWFDAQAFEKTAISFNHELNTHLGVEDAPVMFINWAVFEAELLQKEVEGMTLEFDREPIKYTAIQLFREGFVLAPEMLAWAEPDLIKMNSCDAHELAKKVRQIWAAVPPEEDLTGVRFTETDIGVQLARLAMVHVHFNRMLQARKKQLAALRGD